MNALLWRSHERSSEITGRKREALFCVPLVMQQRLRSMGDEVSKISREIEDKAVAAPRNISQNTCLATFFTRTPIAFNRSDKDVLRKALIFDLERVCSAMYSQQTTMAKVSFLKNAHAIEARRSSGMGFECEVLNITTTRRFRTVINRISCEGVRKTGSNH